MKTTKNGRLRWGLILGVLVAVFIVARAVVPYIVLDRVNKYLAHFSESYYAHIEDLDLNFLRSSYSFDQIKVALKATPDKPFLTVESVDVSIAWRELFRGRVLTDIVIKQAHFEADTQFAQPAQKNVQKTQDEAVAAGKKLFPVDVERIEIRNSKMNYASYNFFVDHIEGRLSRVFATEENPLSLLTLKGDVLGKFPLKIVGDLNLLKTPKAWVMAAELQNFNTVSANSFVSRFAPLTFKNGQLDIYAEVKSEDGRISGYVKPFLKDAEVMGDDKDFKSLKHFGIELSVAFVNALFKSSKDKVVATRVLFQHEDGKFQWNARETVAELFKNGYRESLPRGIENLMSLNVEEKKSESN